MRLLLLSLLGLTALVGPVGAAEPVVRPVPADVALPTSGPRLLVPPDVLADAVRCEGDVASAALAPVLLLHGTGSTPQESFGPVFLPQLTAAGYPVCTVQLPERATGDMQVSSEYVVSAIRSVAAMRGGRIFVVGHSQGATLAVIALKYWPDLPGLVEDYVGLAPTLSPGVTGDALCAMSCSAPFQQRRRESVYFNGVMGHALPPGPSYTTIATRFDEIAAPAPQASRLEGARNVVLQDRCPAKVVDHFGLLVDGTVFALVIDGLREAGTVDPARIPDSVCLDTLPPGSDPADVGPPAAQAVVASLQANRDAERLTEEPPVRCYVLPDCADVEDRGRLLVDPSVQEGVVRAQVQSYGVRVETTTDFYRAAGLELTDNVVAASAGTAGSTAPTAAPDSAAAGPRLPATGAGSALPVALLMVTIGLLGQHLCRCSASDRPTA